MEILNNYASRFVFLFRQDSTVIVLSVLILGAVISIPIYYINRKRLKNRVINRLTEIIGNYRKETARQAIEVAESTIASRPELNEKAGNMPWPVYFRFLRYIAVLTIDSNPEFVFHSTGLARLFGHRRKRNVKPRVPNSEVILEGWWKRKDRTKYGTCHSCGSDLVLENNILRCPNCGETFPPLIVL